MLITNEQCFLDARDVLNFAQEDFHARSIAKQRAQYGSYQLPETPDEFLWWILDEAEIQETQGDTEFYEYNKEVDAFAAATAFQYSTHLRRVATELLKLGIQPQPPTK